MRIDPRVNFLSVIFITTSSFIVTDIWFNLLLLSLAFTLAISVGVKWTDTKGYFKRLLMLGILIFLIQALFYRSGDRIVSLPGEISLLGSNIDVPSFLAEKALVSRSGVKFGTYLVLRFGIIIMMAVYFHKSTTPSLFISGITKMGVPHSVGFGANIALRFIPQMTKEVEEMKAAQQARGRRFSEGNVFHRMRNLGSLLRPLVVRYVLRTRYISQVLRSRGYVPGEKRSSIYRLKMNVFDWTYLASLVGLLTLTISYRFF